MPIRYGEVDFPYLKEALRYYIEHNPNSHYHYKELFNLFKTEPCVICTDVAYKESESIRVKGKIICGKCVDDLHESK